MRGWALFGILVCNLVLFGPINLWVVWPDQVQRIALQLVDYLASGKFYTLFSFLFGIGFAIQLERAERRGGRFLGVYVRRMVVLLAMGLVHSLFWDGDFLHRYALMGMLLLLFRRFSPRALLIAALVFFIVSPVLHQGIERLGQPSVVDPEVATVTAREATQGGTQGFASRERRVRIFDEGSFTDVVAMSVRDAVQPGWAGWRAAYVFGRQFALILLGFFVVRRKIIHDLRAHRRLVWYVLLGGLVLGALGTITNFLLSAGTIGDGWQRELVRLVARTSYYYGGVGLCLFYACTLILLSMRERWRQILSPLAAAGRMPLTNYLMQTVIFTALLHGWGLGLVTEAGPADRLVMVVAIFSFQLVFSVWWLRHFRFGPLEWLWRTLTYMKAPRMQDKERRPIEEAASHA